MTEILGAFTGTLSAAGLFNNCVDCFDYIQLARNFGTDYEDCQLKLDVCRNRLSRWGEAAKVRSDLDFASEAPEDGSNGKLANEVLAEIAMLFHSAERKSLRYMKKEDKEMAPVHSSDGAELSSTGRRVHGRLTIAVQRQGSTSLAKKTYWALWDARSFDKLIKDLSYYIGELEGIVPALEEYRLLAERVTSGLNDPPGLEALYNAARDNDEILFEAAGRRLAEFQGRNEGTNLKATKNSTARVGNIYYDSFKFPTGTWTDKTENKGKNLVAYENSTVTVGTVFGTARLG